MLCCRWFCPWPALPLVYKSHHSVTKWQRVTSEHSMGNFEEFWSAILNSYTSVYKLKAVQKKWLLSFTILSRFLCFVINLSHCLDLSCGTSYTHIKNLKIKNWQLIYIKECIMYHFLLQLLSATYHVPVTIYLLDLLNFAVPPEMF